MKKLRYLSADTGYGALVDENVATKDGDLCFAILSRQVFENINPNLNSPDKCKIVLAEEELNLAGVPVLPNWRLWEVEQMQANGQPVVLKDWFGGRLGAIFVETGAGKGDKMQKYSRPIEPTTELSTTNEAIKPIEPTPKYIVVETEELLGDEGIIAIAFGEPGYRIKLITNSKGKQECVIKEIIY